MLFRPLRQIADKFNTLQMGMVAANRVFRILDSSEFINDGASSNLKEFNGHVVFKNVEFSYDSKNNVFKGLNLDIKSGEKVAIVGSTGSGKTTIINLLLRFYELKKGEILIDGKNIKDMSLDFLRSNISLVSQNIFLFADSIFNNIVLYNKEISKEKVIEASKKIGIHKFITKLPGSYDYNVKERGAMLSEGQKQLISFLRAYVNDPSILILDEATSSVDSKTEELIQYATTKIIENKTSIIIAHRLSTILNSNKIIVLDKGEIKEIGSHRDLIKIDNGYYKKLFELQFQKEQLVS
jgi:subfamily B ATP-binding cassette protein MsbA